MPIYSDFFIDISVVICNAFIGDLIYIFLKLCNVRLNHFLFIFFTPFLVGCDGFGFRDWSWHQKLTVVIQTPAGEVSGTSVSAVELSASPSWWGLGDGGGAGRASISGEAVAVEVADGTFVFVVMENYSHETALEAFRLKKEVLSKVEIESTFDEIEQSKATKRLPKSQYPTIVYFKYLNNPDTLTLVNNENFYKLFGVGYEIKSVDITITDDTVTIGVIENIIPWLKEAGRERGTILSQAARRKIPNADFELKNLSPISFSTELYK